MAKQTIDALVEGGAASGGPPLGPALGPTGVPIKKVIDMINEKTSAFKGMRVPVKVIVDTDSKTFDIKVGTPSTSQLIKAEVKLEKLAKKPGIERVADIRMEQLIKIAKMKAESLFGSSSVEAVRQVVGTCLSVGVLVEGKSPKEVLAEIDRGVYVDKIKAGKTELTAEELKALEERKKALAAEIQKRLEDERVKAQKILAEMAGQEEVAIRKRLEAERISEEIIEDVIKGGAAPKAEEKKK